jgi:hypothetical protein
VVARPDVDERPRPEPVHARVGLVDRVPAEPLRDPADRREARARVELERAVHVLGRDADEPPCAVAPDGLLDAAAGDPESRVGAHAVEHVGEVPPGKLDVGVDLADVREPGGVAAMQRPVERTRLERPGQPVARAVGGLGDADHARERR